MRKKRVYKKYLEPDFNYNRVDFGRFINYLMKEGKKSVATKIFYTAFEKVKKETSQDPILVFEKAIQNVSPVLEVVSRRVGGANYQVPQEVSPARRFILATRWLIAAARARKGIPMNSRLAAEIIAASKGEGASIKKKQDTHRMAEANRAFAHFARRPSK
ncbi:MAG: 30S ribosomal protein S7 [Candidatus Liptonbacteria bacterium]|nr:30S ribosomal protein S7 [Candidatus Liptonbacteria bacterium]